MTDTILTERRGPILVVTIDRLSLERMAPPTLGQHTDAVLAEVLGWDGQKLAELRAQGAIG